MTGRKYARTGLSRPLWVAREDADARPDWWRVVAPNPDDVSPDVDTVLRLIDESRQQVDVDGLSRDEIKLLLDQLGANYNKRRSTDNLRARLQEALNAANDSTDAGDVATV